jgi:polyphosphate glucokinase
VGAKTRRRSPSRRAKQRRPPPAAPASAIRTLGVDIGGTGIKAVILNELGGALSKPLRARTPSPATPESVLRVVTRLASRQGEFDRVSVGFPGVVCAGICKIAPNLAPTWENVNVAGLVESRLGKPVRVANDADVQGFGAIAGKGVELVITLGTGVGSALFIDGRLVPNVEVGRRRLSDASRRKAGLVRWQRRVAKFVRRLEEMFHFDQLYIGGGNARYLDIKKLPPNVRIISNLNGLVGGISLWRAAADGSPAADADARP